MIYRIIEYHYERQPNIFKLQKRKRIWGFLWYVWKTYEGAEAYDGDGWTFFTSLGMSFRDRNEIDEVIEKDMKENERPYQTVSEVIIK